MTPIYDAIHPTKLRERKQEHGQSDFKLSVIKNETPKLHNATYQTYLIF